MHVPAQQGTTTVSDPGRGAGRRGIDHDEEPVDALPIRPCGATAAGEQGDDTAVLEPSPAGAGMHRRMGFEPLSTDLAAAIPPLDGP